MRTWQSLAAVKLLAAIAIAVWIAVLVVMSVPAFPATIKPSAYDTCLMRAALQSPYYSSTDQGDSAIALMHFCDPSRFDWINECTTRNSNFYDCSMKSAMRAMLTIVLAEDARTGGH